jgi:hypothetical protein
MIPKASQRAFGPDLATHLQNAYDNELVEVAHLRGAIAGDLHGAFKEWEVQADTLTKCKEYLYSLSINPDPAQPLTREQYMDYIDRTEQKLGLADQPRAVVFHTKYGREHCHVVWSRIDVEKEKAVHLAYDHDKLMRITRGFARDHGLTLPDGYYKSRQAGQVPLHVLENQRRTGLSLDDHKQQVTDAWRQSDTPRSLVNALAERGYILAAGRRGHVVVDLYGGVHPVSRLVDDKSVRTNHVREFLEREFPLKTLPTVAEAENLVSAHRELIERDIEQEVIASHVDELKHAQQERRRAVEQERETLKDRQKHLRQSQDSLHRAERIKLRAEHLAKMKAVRLERYQNRPTGLANFLGRVSGVNLVRQKLHRYQDAKRTREYLHQQAELKTRQAHEQKALSLRLKIQTQTIEQKAQSLEKIDRREMSALMRDLKRDQRVRDRDEDGVMPSLVKMEGRIKEVEKPAPDLLAEFEKAKQTPDTQVPDLIAEFERASRGGGRITERDDTGSKDRDIPDPSLDRSR